MNKVLTEFGVSAATVLVSELNREDAALVVVHLLYLCLSVTVRVYP